MSPRGAVAGRLTAALSLLVALSLSLSLSLSLAGCGGGDAPLPSPEPESDGSPQRIVSLCPATTEIVRRLGMGDRLVGVSSYCTQPAGEGAAAVVGSVSRPDYAAILRLSPDLVLTTPHPEVEAQLAALDKETMSVSLDSFQLLLDGIRSIGRRLGADDAGRELEREALDVIERQRARYAELPGQRVLFVFGPSSDGWVAGYQSIVQDMIHFTGSVNAATGKGAKLYPLAWEDVGDASPDVIIVAVPRDQIDARRAQLERRYWRRHGAAPAVRQGRIVLVADDAFAASGLGALAAWEQLAQALHPEALAARGD